MAKRIFAFTLMLIAMGFLFSTITVTSPNGGENWIPTRYYNITWTSSGVTGNVRIELFRFSGINFYTTTINNSIDVSTGVYNWHIPIDTVPSTNYSIKISSVTNTSEYDFSNNYFTITAAPTITVTSPNGGESWNIGDIYPITWTSTNLTGNLGIKLLIGTYGNYYTVGFAQNVTAGSYDWTIQSPVPPGTQMKIVLYNPLQPAIADTSDNFFTILQAPGIYLTSPNGGEHWFRGSSYPIQWTSVNITGSAKIELFRGTNTTPTATVVSSTIVTNGIQMWNIPTTIPEADDYKIKITSLSNSSVSDISSNFFTITDFVGNEDPQVPPLATALQGNYPNPFRKETTIKYSVKDSEDVGLNIYDVKGRIVKRLLNANSSAGSFSTTWDGTDDAGKQLSNGVYYLQLKTDSYKTSRKVVLLR
ncbi:MAG: Ser-Thr-rich GPI-anchored membrane family protein [Candidatus Cloacimonadaceae bacterium]